MSETGRILSLLLVIMVLPVMVALMYSVRPTAVKEYLRVMLIASLAGGITGSIVAAVLLL